jgi:hypothetical protein
MQNLYLVLRGPLEILQGNCVTNNRRRLAIYNQPVAEQPEETNLALKKAYARINAMIANTALQSSYGKVALNAFPLLWARQHFLGQTTWTTRTSQIQHRGGSALPVAKATPSSLN